MRARAIPAALTLVGLCLSAACGSSTSDLPSANGTRVTQETPTPPPTPTTEARISETAARTLATAGVLRPDDLPGYTHARGKVFTAAEAKTDDRCSTLDLDRFVVGNKSAFTMNYVSITSEAHVLATPQFAADDFQEVASDAGLACLRKAMRDSTAKRGLKGVKTSLTRSPITVPGAEETFGYLMSISSADGTVRSRMAGARVGNTTVMVSVMNLSGLEPKLARSAELLTTAVDRVRSAAATAPLPTA